VNEIVLILVGSRRQIRGGITEIVMVLAENHGGVGDHVAVQDNVASAIMVALYIRGDVGDRMFGRTAGTRRTQLHFCNDLDDPHPPPISNIGERVEVRRRTCPVAPQHQGAFSNSRPKASAYRACELPSATCRAPARRRRRHH
jgi:hypothetical protein